jgi:hypothetical protein
MKQATSGWYIYSVDELPPEIIAPAGMSSNSSKVSIPTYAPTTQPRNSYELRICRIASSLTTLCLNKEEICR